MKYKVMIGDVPCWWQKMKPVNLNRYGIEKRYCPLCNKELYTTDGCILVINNYILFPNVSCHISCAPNGLDKEMITVIWELYKDSKIALKRAIEDGKPWFHHIKI